MGAKRGFRVLAFASMLLSTACYKWISPDGGFEEVIRGAGSRTVRLTTGDSTLVMNDPRLIGDTVEGRVSTWDRGAETLEIVRVPLDEIALVEWREKDGFKSGLLAGGISAATLAALLISVNSAPDGDPIVIETCLNIVWGDCG
jgi:hypothetical protein